MDIYGLDAVIVDATVVAETVLDEDHPRLKDYNLVASYITFLKRKFGEL